MTEQITDEPKYNPETVKTVLNVLQKEFEVEQERDRFITSKVQMMLTVAGILLTSIIFLLKTIYEQKWYINLNASLLMMAMLIIIIAIIIFLNVMRIKTFQRIDYEKLVFNKELEKKVQDVESRLIATYEETLKKNVPVVDNMANVFQKGTKLIMISISMIYVVLLTILSIIIRTFIGGNV
ncbi:MAG: hypothetical protein HY754_03830 [Nitrospirae bacterium]|nr:hypothetical protein [Nitrospirota bacterium]